MAAGILRRRPWLEPWYDWGSYGWGRLDEKGENSAACERAWRVELEWFGLKILVVVGLQPPIDPRLNSDEKGSADAI